MKKTLETERLILRPFRMEDAQAMYEGWASDPEVTRFLTWDPHKDIETTKAILAKWLKEYEKPERLNFAIELKENGKLIGGIDIVGYLGGVSGTPVIGYNLSKEYWRKGYMTEACRCVLDHLFSLGYEQVRIDAFKDNVASKRVIEKCGGVYLETTEDYLPLKDRTVTRDCYTVKKN